MPSQTHFVEHLYKYLEFQAIDQMNELGAQWSEHHPTEPEIVQYEVFQQVAALPEVRMIQRDESLDLTDEPIFVDALSITVEEYEKYDYPLSPDTPLVGYVTARYDWDKFALTRGRPWEVYGGQKWTTRGGGENPGPRQSALVQERPDGWEAATLSSDLNVDPSDQRDPYTIEHLWWCGLHGKEAHQPH